jgi:hypothetical protein
MGTVEPSVLANLLRGTRPSELWSVLGSELLNATNEITAPQIMTLLSSRGINWKTSADAYFQIIHPWLSIVQMDLFSQKMDPDRSHHSKTRPQEIALLLVCMHLVITPASDLRMDLGVKVEGGPTSNPLYMSVKRLFALMKSCGTPSVELVQCGVLLTLFEYGHGDCARAYMTLGESATMSCLIGATPGKYVDSEKQDPVALEDEQKRVLYWGLYIMEK